MIWIVIPFTLLACQPSIAPHFPTDYDEISCEMDSFSPGEGLAQNDGDNWYYELTSADRRTRVRIDLLNKWGGPNSPGTYSLDGVNYRDCGLCVTAYAECDEEGCQKTLYADQGTVLIDHLGSVSGQRISGTLKNVVFREVTIATDWSSTPVEGGRTWCLDTLRFDQVLGTANDVDLSGEIVPEEPSSRCDATGTGTGIGANIADFPLQNCRGEWVSLHDLACSEEGGALWLVASADWCAPCHNYSAKAQLILEEHRHHGLGLMNVIGENALGEPPSLDTCQAYASQHNLSYDRTFIDPHWETLWKFVYPYGSVEATVFLPWVAVLKRANGEYRFNNQIHVMTSEFEVIEELLSEASSAQNDSGP